MKTSLRITPLIFLSLLSVLILVSSRKNGNMFSAFDETDRCLIEFMSSRCRETSDADKDRLMNLFFLEKHTDIGRFRLLTDGKIGQSDFLSAFDKKGFAKEECIISKLEKGTLFYPINDLSSFAEKPTSDEKRLISSLLSYDPMPDAVVSQSGVRYVYGENYFLTSGDKTDVFCIDEKGSGLFLNSTLKREFSEFLFESPHSPKMHTDRVSGRLKYGHFGENDESSDTVNFEFTVDGYLILMTIPKKPINESNIE